MWRGKRGEGAGDRERKTGRRRERWGEEDGKSEMGRGG